MWALVICKCVFPLGQDTLSLPRTHRAPGDGVEQVPEKCATFSDVLNPRRVLMVRFIITSLVLPFMFF